jgi:hypothetical protein
MAIHGFVLEEFTKPAHEHHLASWPARLQAFFSFCMPGPLNSRLLQPTKSV